VISRANWLVADESAVCHSAGGDYGHVTYGIYVSHIIIRTTKKLVMGKSRPRIYWNSLRLWYQMMWQCTMRFILYLLTTIAFEKNRNNDLFSVDTCVKFFADDVKLYSKMCANPHSLEEDLNRIVEWSDWSHTWQLPISYSKCCILDLHHSPDITYTVDNCVLSTVNVKCQCQM